MPYPPYDAFRFIWSHAVYSSRPSSFTEDGSIAMPPIGGAAQRFGRSCWGLRVHDEMHSIDEVEGRWSALGVIAAQWRMNGQLRVVLAGTTGPATLACARLLPNIPAVAPPAVAPSRPPQPAEKTYATAEVLGKTEVAQVVRVVDGDTVKLADGRKVRLIGINCPERDRPLYGEATRALKDLVEGQQVTLEFDAEARDKYKRVLAYLHKDDLFVNGEIVRLGLAYCYTWKPNTAHMDDLVRFQVSAREAKWPG